MSNITRIKTECKRMFETKITIGSGVNVVYSKIIIGKNVYRTKEKLATASKFWYIIIFSLVKYCNLTNICKTKYREMQNTKKFSVIVPINTGIIPKEKYIKIAIEFNRTTNLLYFFEHKPAFCS